ncbi:MAG: histone deacetylase family protein [Woeseiaceae bacterium]|nr:histone deacetylase family protein [Woeseiaceae bacterium]
MKVVFSDRQLAHAPKSFLSSGAEHPNPEVPGRAACLLEAALGAGLEQVEPGDYGRDALAAVHTARYLDFLARIHQRWQYIDGASADVMPNIHPAGRGFGYPASAVGQVGFHVYDGSCPVTAATWDAACWSANTAVHAAELVLAGDPACYALCRPPGHHAGREVVGGFCYLSNAAIAVRRLQGAHERVAILDVDVHHGNGTQDVFWEDPTVLTVSIHADPVRFYPFFWGYADEAGGGAGEGFNLNLPLPRGTGDDDYATALGTVLARIRDFEPGALVVALGLDAHESDPFQGFAMTTSGFGHIGERVAGLGLPTVLVQEGGYLNDELGASLAAFLDGFGAAAG